MTAPAAEIRRHPAAEPVLIVTPLEGVESTAAALAEELGRAVDVASTRAAALRLLGRRAYAAIVLDQMLAEADPEGASLIWKSAGLAIPIPIHFAVSRAERVAQELRAALARRHRETQLATAAATVALDTEIKNAVTALLLESQLALSLTAAPSELADRLRTVASIAAQLRDRLAAAPAPPTTLAGLPVPRG